MRKRRCTPLGITLLCASLLWPACSWAFRVSPMIVNFSPSGRGATQTFVLDNNGSDKIAVQLETFHRYIDIDGRETRTPTDEFSVYPQQVALQPNEKRNVRVTWTGTRDIDRELAYRLVVTELPVNLKPPAQRKSRPGANITFLMQYVASLYITPAGALPHVVVDSFKLLPDGKGELVLLNEGTVHRVLKGIHVKFKLPDGSHAEVAQSALQDLQSENILPKEKRRFSLALPAAVVHAEKTKPASVEVSVELK